MKKLTLIFSLFLVVGCASTGVHYEWDSYKEDVCKKRLFGKKVCNEVNKMGWIPKEKFVLKGTGVKVDFEKNTAEGGTLIPPLPNLKVQN